MKLIHHFAGCGVIMLAIVWSGWAAEPTTDAGRQTPDGGGQPAAPVMFMPPAGGPVNTGGPAIAGGTNAAGRTSPFSAEIGADFIKKVMETSAKIEEAKRRIAERQAQLYASNPEIKSTRARMIEGQQEINRVLDADKELTELKMSRDILWSTMPALPKGQNPASMPRLPMAR